jgi:hypothetical protein
MGCVKSKLPAILMSLAMLVAVGAVFNSVTVKQVNAKDLADYCARPPVDPFKMKLACIGQVPR